MQTKKIISMLLCLLMLVSMTMLASCDKSDDESSGTSSDATTNKGENLEDYVDMPEFRWEGDDFKEFHVAIYSNEQQTTYCCEDVEPNLYSTTDASLNDAVIRRNNEILNKYGVTIVGEPVADVAEALKQDVSSNLKQYDAALPFMWKAATLAQDDYLYDLNEFTDYLHFDQPWWDQHATESLSIGNKLFFTTGDISIMPKITSTAITFNKEMLKKYFPDTDLYQMVKDKTWTFDKMVEMSREVTADTDGTPGMSYTDTWGLSSSHNDVSAFFIAGGKNYIQKDSDDIPVVSMTDTASTTAIQKILEDLQLTDEWVFHCDTINDEAQKWVISLDIFGQNRALFRTSAFSAIKKLRQYDDADEFGIVPLPLLSEDQDEYYTYASAKYAYGIVIPASLSEDEAEFSAFMIEAMAFGGMKYITPAYYETTLKYRDLRDDESGEMLDLVFDNVVYDLGIIYDFGGVSSMITNLMKKNSTGVASEYEANASAIQTAIDKCIESYNN